jgi:phosphopantothenoylcysteine decarboxylase/phosphopantothenate--cysteine ligase
MTSITGCLNQRLKNKLQYSGMLEGKKILLGITASIAAYKAATLVRLLVKEGAEVQVIMTPVAKEFITPVTLSALSGKPVFSDFFSSLGGQWNSHVDMGLWADLFLVAPATASTLAKMANGIADNLLITTYLSCKCPVVLAPAMDLDMFQHPSTTRNIELLKSYGNHIIEPGTGELASGLYGKGRMKEPDIILEEIKPFIEAAAGGKGTK